MFEILGKILIGIILGIAGLIAIETLKGGVVIRGSQRDKNIDKRVKDRLSSSPGSSKAELQEWWDTYHPSK